MKVWSPTKGGLHSQKDENIQKRRPVEEIIDDDDDIELEGLINQTVSPQANSELCFRKSNSL